MNKILKGSMALVLSLGLAACSSKDGGDSTQTPDVEGTETPVVDSGECAVTVGLVTDTGGVDDKSFNQSAWEGLVQFQKENGLSDDCISYLQSSSDADYVPNLSQFADDEYDLVIAVGYLFGDAIQTVSTNYPEVNFLFIDAVLENENVMSAIYAAEDGSFLVGVAAGLTAAENGSNIVGFVGGAEGQLIGSFQAGFEQGVLAANPDATILVDYADSFEDDGKGQALAIKQYDAGATVIYQAAGGAGNGVIKEAKERGDVWAIGVDKDQYEEGMTASGKSIILTSMIKRVDLATYRAAQAILDENFASGVERFELSNDGVTAELTSGRNLSDEVITAVKEYAEKIKSGEINVSTEPTIKNGSSNK